ncbi:hypothetical protein [Aneurinibacillus aneurinilyticus]|uniref:hypothetical protein n=1 Tax=Aneurinibacillus aneurinilyticus TaxID=1391 RepID=UPI0023F89134|nr:hypothetical protein [Aneurinibacillus aneurinilyticus]MCI1692487.1 hypothetical protein [Aneurinibacillus aneurinilyticus]
MFREEKATTTGHKQGLSSPFPSDCYGQAKKDGNCLPLCAYPDVLQSRLAGAKSGPLSLGAGEGGHRLRRYMPWYYVIFFGNNALQRFVLKFPELVTDTLILFSVTVDLLLNLICLWMAQSIIRSLDAAWLSRTESPVSSEQTSENPQPSIPL